MSETNFFYDTDLTGRVIKANAMKKKDDNEREIKSLTIDIEIKCEPRIIISYNPYMAKTIYDEDGILNRRSFMTIDFGAQNVNNLRFQSGDHIAQGVSITKLKAKILTKDEVEGLYLIFTLEVPEDGNKAHVWNIASLIKDEDITFQLSKTQLEVFDEDTKKVAINSANKFKKTLDDVDMEVNSVDKKNGKLTISVVDKKE